MAHVFDRNPRWPAVPAGKQSPPTAKRTLSLEYIAFTVAIVLPVLTFCGRTVYERLANRVVLILEWPEQCRPEATLQLNGAPQKVAVAGPLEYRCDPGEICIVVTAPGSKPFRRTVFVESGQKKAVPIAWPGLEGPRHSRNTASSPESTGRNPSSDRIAGDTLPRAAVVAADTPGEIERAAGTARSRPSKTEASAADAASATDNSVKRTRQPTSAVADKPARPAVPDAPGTNPPGAMPPPTGAPTKASGVQARAHPSPRAVPHAPTGLPEPSQTEFVVTFAPGQLPPSITSGRGIGAAAAAPPAGTAATASGVPADRLIWTTNRGPAAAAPTLGPAPSTTLPLAAQPASSVVKPIATVADPEVERLLLEAWGLIERGDYEPGSLKLLEARKRNREDPRADFSLGLIDALINHDWASAEKRFADCVRRDPENVPSLNNLAIAKLHNKRESEAVKHWKAIVEQQAATAEVVQNLGRLRQLIKDGTIRKTPSFAKSVDSLYTEAAVATSQSAQPQGGFHLMVLQLADGRFVGWSFAGRMVDSWPPPAPADPRVRPSAPVQPGETGNMPPPPNAPAVPRKSRARN